MGALERGDNVAAVARSRDRLEELSREYGAAVLPLVVDIRERQAVFAAVEQTQKHFGRIDVVINNAGYSHRGMVEEFTEAEVRSLFDTNFFGPLWVTQAVLPIMRGQGWGHILQVSSLGGLVGSSYLGVYASSKWALEGLSQSLAQEVRGFGLKVTIVEPAGYRTGRVADSRYADPHPAYEVQRQRQAEISALAESRAGDPEATRSAILELVDSKDPPLRLLLGKGIVGILADEYESRLAVWRSWEAVSEAAYGVPNLQ
jgi:NAD(P)-dependent dehydrogenase (short-subunit alcohol dehydrogenase family)